MTQAMMIILAAYLIGLGGFPLRAFFTNDRNALDFLFVPAGLLMVMVGIHLAIPFFTG